MAAGASFRPMVLVGLLLTTLTLSAAAVPGPEAAPIVFVDPPRSGLAPAGHIDTPTSDLYVAETLTSARWTVRATQERFLGRPFWIEPLTGAGTRVAIVDTGVDPEHPDLVGSIVAWRDFLFSRPQPYDDDTHGTHVAGIVAAHGHFQYRPDRHYFPFGARGVAPGAELIVAKAMDTNGDGDARHVADAILWSLDPNGDGDYSDGAHVINLSIGLETAPPRDGDGPIGGPITLPGFQTRSGPEADIVRDAIRTAVRAGAIVVVAAGNHEPGAPDHTVSFPGTMPEVITVGALDADGRVAAFSNTGAPGSLKPDLVAPGVLLSTFPEVRDFDDSDRDGYVALGGTSMAAPLVTGTVALMLEADPRLRGLSATQDLSWHTEEVRNVLVTTADGAAYDPTTGYGILQVDAAARQVDLGEGPPNWDMLAGLLILAVAVIGIVLLRRRRAAHLARVRRAKAEARARLTGQEVPEVAEVAERAGDPAGGNEPGGDGGGAEGPSVPRSAAVRPAAPASADTSEGGPPPWQTPPWERPGHER